MKLMVNGLVLCLICLAGASSVPYKRGYDSTTFRDAVGAQVEDPNAEVEFRAKFPYRQASTNVSSKSMVMDDKTRPIIPSLIGKLSPKAPSVSPDPASVAISPKHIREIEMRFEPLLVPSNQRITTSAFPSGTQSEGAKEIPPPALNTGSRKSSCQRQNPPSVPPTPRLRFKFPRPNTLQEFIIYWPQIRSVACLVHDRGMLAGDPTLDEVRELLYYNEVSWLGSWLDHWGQWRLKRTLAGQPFNTCIQMAKSWGLPGSQNRD